MNDPPYIEGEARRITNCADCKKDILDDEFYAQTTDWWGLVKKDLCIVCYEKWKKAHKKK